MQSSTLRRYTPTVVLVSKADEILQPQIPTLTPARPHNQSSLSISAKPIARIQANKPRTKTSIYSFVSAMLKALQLPNTFIGWTETCFKEARYYISFNESLIGFFKGARGIRQGDPLSPILFVLAMNVLSIILNMAATKGLFGYHPKCKKIGLTYLSFADDLLIFCKGNIESVSGVISVFDQFYEMSGLKLNAVKCELYTAGITFRNLEHILQSTQLILPQAIVNNIEQLCSRFFWKGTDKAATRARVSWQKICLAKSEGGLGLKDIKTWNKACMIQLIRTILEGEGSLWVAWIKSYVIKGEDFLLVDEIANSNRCIRCLLKLRAAAIPVLSIGATKTKDFWKELRSHLHLSLSKATSVPISDEISPHLRRYQSPSPAKSFTVRNGKSTKSTTEEVKSRLSCMQKVEEEVELSKASMESCPCELLDGNFGSYYCKNTTALKPEVSLESQRSVILRSLLLDFAEHPSYSEVTYQDKSSARKEKASVHFNGSIGNEDDYDEEQFEEMGDGYYEEVEDNDHDTKRLTSHTNFQLLTITNVNDEGVDLNKGPLREDPTKGLSGPSMIQGIEVKPGIPHPYHSGSVRGKLHIARATLGLGSSKQRAVLQCSVGHKSPIILCSLLPNHNETCSLDLKFDEDDDLVAFSVIGSQSIHLSGYFVADDRGHLRDEYESDSYGEDIAQTESEDESDSDDEYSDDFIDDNDREFYPPSPVPNSGVVLRRSWMMKNLQANLETEDEDGFPVSASHNSKEPQPETEKKREILLLKKTRRQEKMLPKRKVKGTDEESQQERRSKPVKGESKDPEQVMPVRNEQDHPHSNKVFGSDSDNVLGENFSKKKKKSKKKTTQLDQVAANASVSQSGDKGTFTLKSEEKQTASKLSQVRTFPNGLVVQELAMGKSNGKIASRGKQVSVHYIGKLQKNGKFFYSNVGRVPFKFRLGVGEIIKGWDVGVEGMRIGDKRNLIIPPAMWYACLFMVLRVLAARLPPNAWLEFDVELIGVRPDSAIHQQQPRPEDPNRSVEAQIVDPNPGRFLSEVSWLQVLGVSKGRGRKWGVMKLLCSPWPPIYGGRGDMLISSARKKKGRAWRE
ncbi:Peptidyl-prolyl cis-trans isomerase FKBP15-3 [Hibiscus syriacus]|uniref:peptidylprolyl isomerase n=1 Tax=Hibiscus syriacus TaxID=106335 RepID=A0A6A3CRR4_HIBSY|nr:Peptidyl-prolyl cis-trans isomerase FKBP15-3 [Hibiscus syriacus]